MVKFTQWIESMIDDVNREDSLTLGYFSHLLQQHFYLILLFGLPFLFYVFLMA